MPSIDVSDVTLDPDFAEPLVIYRREQIVDGHGRTTVPAPVLIAPAPWGVVLPQDDQPLQRGPDQQNLPQLLEVHTVFRLRSAAKDGAGKVWQPDIIVWNSTQFLVNRIYNFSHFGFGFIRAACSSIDAVDGVPV